MGTTQLHTWSEVTTGNIRWWVAPALESALHGPNGLNLDQAVVIKRGPHRVVYRVELTDGQTIYVKHNLVPDVRTWLRQMVRPSKARIEFDRAVELATRGVPTITPLALGEREAWFGAGESFLVTRALERTQTLNTFLMDSLLPLPMALTGQLKGCSPTMEDRKKRGAQHRIPGSSLANVHKLSGRCILFLFHHHDRW